MNAEAILLSVMMALIGVLMWFVPVMKGPDAFFGIPVSDDYYRGEDARRMLLAYRLVVLVLCAGPLALLLGLVPGVVMTPGLLLLAILAPALGPMMPLVLCWYAVRPHEQHPELHAPLPGEAPQPRSAWRYVSPWVEGVLAGCFLAAAALTVWQYPNLPERIPTHWNAAGQADGWSDKAVWPYAALLGMLAYMHVLFLWINVGLGQVPMGLPEQRQQEFIAARERYMRLWARFMDVMRASIVLIFGGIIWASLFGIEKQAEGGMPPGMIVVWVGTGLMFLSMPWVIVAGLRRRKEMREIAGPGSIESAAPTEGWIAGMIYYNKQDPAVWVEKRVGIGWTLNFAHSVSWAFMAFALGVPIAATVLALVAAK